MKLFMKTLDAEVISKAFALYYKCRSMEDIISNVIAGNIEVKNKELYDDLHKQYMQNLIAYEFELKKIEDIVFGKNMIIPSCATYLSPTRAKFIVDMHVTKGTERDDIKNFLLKRGFEEFDI